MSDYLSLFYNKENHAIEDFMRLTQHEWAVVFDSLLKPTPYVSQVDNETNAAEILIFVPWITTVPSSVAARIIYTIIQHRKRIPTNCIHFLHNVLSNHELLPMWARLLLTELSVSELGNIIDDSTENTYTHALSIDRQKKCCHVKNCKMTPSEVYKLCLDNNSILSDIMERIRTLDIANSDSTVKVPPSNEDIELSTDTNEVIFIEDSPKETDYEENTDESRCVKRQHESSTDSDSANRGLFKKPKTGTNETTRPTAIIVPITPTHSDSQLGLSQSFLSSQTSHIQPNCPFENYSGHVLSKSQLADLSVIHEFWESLRSDHDITSELNVFVDLTPQGMDESCCLLGVDSLRDSSLSTCVSHLCTLAGRISLTNIQIFIRYALLPKVLKQSVTVARLLQTILNTLASTFAESVTQAFVIPLVETGLTLDQSDAVCQLIRESYSPLTRQQALEGLIDCAFVVTDGYIFLLLSLIDMQITISGTCLTKLVAMLETQSVKLSSDLKFAKLLLNFVKNYSKQFLPEHKSTLAMLCAHNKTFLKRSLQSAISNSLT